MPGVLFYEQEVLDIVYNPGEEVFLALFKDNKLSLYAKHEKEPKMIFDQQQQTVTQVQWLDNISGDFVSIYANLGVLRIWNAAQSAPKQMIKVSPHGI
jgi:WD40 repeat protein